MKIENRSICSEVISVKLFCREKGFKNVLYFYFVLLFFANKLLCLCQCIFFQSDFYFPYHSLSVLYRYTRDKGEGRISSLSDHLVVPHP